MLIYLFKSTACLALFLAFYKVFLENEQMHLFKRFYLIAIIVVSVSIPAIVFTEYVEIQKPITTNMAYSTLPDLDKSTRFTTPNKPFNWTVIAWGFYGLGLLVFGTKFLRNIVQIYHRINRNTKVSTPSNTKVLLEKTTVPHTFFHYIFLNKKKYLDRQIPVSVLLHEETHAQQKHSVDVLLVELLQVLFWFNPLIYVLKHCIKLNHEFLADQAVLREGANPSDYQKTILHYSSIHQPSLANAINYSSIKKRFTVMKKQTSKKSIVVRSFLLLPLIALLLFGFSDRKIVEVPKSNNTINEVAILIEDIEIRIDNGGKLFIQNNLPINLESLEHQLLSLNSNLSKEERKKQIRAVIHVEPNTPKDVISEVEKILTEYGTATINIVGPESSIQSRQQQGATPKQLKKYNTLAKKYNDMDRNHMSIKKQEVDTLKEIYALMSKKQKADAEPFPDLPEPPPAPERPKAPNTTDYATKVIEEIIAEQNPYDVVGQSIRLSQPPLPEPPLAPTYVKDIDPTSPPPPPTPKSPLQHIEEMAQKGARFVHNSKEISAEKAMEIVKKTNHINIDTRGTSGKRPIVKLTTKPIKTGN